MDEGLRKLEREVEAAGADVELARRYDHALLRAGQQEVVAQRYRAKFVCPLRFSELGRTEDAWVRDCGQCQRQVRYCKTAGELAESVAAGHCVAFRRSDMPGVLVTLAKAPALHSAQEPTRPCVVNSELEWVDLGAGVPSLELLSLVPPEWAQRHRMIPAGFDGSTLLVARANSDADVFLLENLKGLVQTDVRFVLAAEADIERALELHYAHLPDLIMGDFFGDV